VSADEASARAVRRAGELWAADACSRGLGIVLVEVGAGRAVLELEITATMADGRRRAHGGMIATLAESALVYAADVGERQHATIDFLRPVAVGERLRAEAREIQCGGEGSVVDVTVSGADHEVVALLRGLSRRASEPD